METHTHTHTSNKRVVCYGYNPSDAVKIRSSLDHSFEIYSSDLTTMMQSIADILIEMSRMNEQSCVFVGIHEDFRKNTEVIPALWEQNEFLLRDLFSGPDSAFIYGILNEPSQPVENNRTGTISSYDSLHQLLVHLTRDWGLSGESVRKSIYYKGVLPALQQHLPEQTSSRILVPGAGLGRLAAEIASLGHKVEANECSGAMVLAMRTIISNILPSYRIPQNPPQNKVDDGSVRQFYPYLHFALRDEWDFSRRLLPEIFPSPDATHVRQWARGDRGSLPGQLAIQHGDFLQIYADGSRAASFDAVVTSFFLDTAPSTADYIAVIKHLLVPGGVWVNAGPLHYHGKIKVPYSYNQVKDIIASMGFVCVHTDLIKSTYCGEEAAFMKPEYYEFPLDVWVLRDNSHSSSDFSFNISFLTSFFGYHKSSDLCKSNNVSHAVGNYTPSVDYIVKNFK